MRKFIPLLLLVACAESKQLQPILSEQNTGTDALLQAISIVDENIVWMSGHKATFVRTMDGGQSWEIFSHPTGDSLQFRDVHAFDAERILLMSAGPGPLSRIFEVNEGKEWRETFVMTDSLGFLDCLDFWDDQRGVAYGDAIDNFPYILLTEDGGQTWERADTTGMPRAGQGEGGFAASGSCVTTGANGLAWIATGAGGNARILKTMDYGNSWATYETPIVKGDAAGLTSVDFVGDQTGFVTGGDLMIADEYTDNCAFTQDGGETWSLTQEPFTSGAFYGSSIINLQDQYFTFVCGPNGLDYSADFGQTWNQLDSTNLWAVNIHPSGIGWASGRGGRVLKVKLQ